MKHNNNVEEKRERRDTEAQVALSFALGVIGGVFIYSIFYMALFLIIFELCFFFICWQWPVKLRLSVIVAYLVGLLVGAYCGQADYPNFF